MTEGNQRIETLNAMFLDELLMWATGVQAMVNERNRLLAAASGLLPMKP